MKSTWKGVRTLIFLEKSPIIVPSTIFGNSQSLPKPQEIANAFNKYFINVARDIQSSIKYSKNNFHEFRTPLDIIFFPSILRIKLM